MGVKKSWVYAAPLDEEGAPWPPELAVVAMVLGPSHLWPQLGVMAVVVEVGPYLYEHDLFECYAVEPASLFGPPAFLRLDELRPLNALTAIYLESAGLVAEAVYPAEVYELAERLGRVDFEVTHAMVSAWTFEQRERLTVACQLVEHGLAPQEALSKAVWG